MVFAASGNSTNLLEVVLELTCLWPNPGHECHWPAPLLFFLFSSLSSLAFLFILFFIMFLVLLCVAVVCLPTPTRRASAPGRKPWPNSPYPPSISVPPAHLVYSFNSKGQKLGQELTPWSIDKAAEEVKACRVWQYVHQLALSFHHSLSVNFFFFLATPALAFDGFALTSTGASTAASASSPIACTFVISLRFNAT